MTAEGVHNIEGQIPSLESARREAKAGDDNAALKHAERDLRYWNQRRARARRRAEPIPMSHASA